MAMGGEAYSQEGAKRSPGTRIIGVSGDVKRPGFYEIVSGSMTFGELLYDVCGGPRDGRQFKAVIPGGSSSKVMRTDAEYKVQNPDGTMGKITFSTFRWIWTASPGTAPCPVPARSSSWTTPAPCPGP